MNHKENHFDASGGAGADIEARVVASVLGEASAFETAELERLLSANPELEIFKRRIEAVHGLIGLAVRPEQAPMRLAPERRAKILQAIGAPPAHAVAQDGAAPVILKFAEARRNRRRRWIWMSGIAASLTLAAIVGLYVGPASLRLEYKGRARKEIPRHVDQSSVSNFQLAMPVVEAADEERNALPASVPVEIPVARGLDAFADSASKSKEDRGKLRGLEGLHSFGAVVAAKRESSFGQSVRAYHYIDPKSLQSAASTKGAMVGAAGSVEESARIVEDADSGEKVLRLSPFEVSASSVSGYAASSTLAGSRLNPKLADIGESIRVVTPEFFVGKDSQARDDNFLSAGTTADLPAGAALAPSRQPQLNDSFVGSLAENTSGPSKVPPAIVAAASSALAEDKRLSQNKPASAPSPVPSEGAQSELSAAEEPISTFSLHVSDVSFRLAQTALARGETPDPARIRPEEFYNAFDYGDPAPTAADKISCRIEQAAHPFLQQRNLVRIAMRVPSAGRGAGQPLHLTVLLDTSGSMEREDRIDSVHRAFDVLASLLNANDRVTLIGFAREPRLLVENLPGDQASQLTTLATQTPFTGGTNLEEALKLSGELAQRHQDAAAQNRIVFITDGAANLGNADPAQLGAMVEGLRQQGISFDACGVGTDGLDDAVLEALTRKGNGRYYVLDKPDDADAGFARQLAGAFRPAAENVKVQVRFNPARVGDYQLIGFEQHRLKTEDFRNDKVDAAELAADEAAVALYQVEVLPDGEGELGEVFVRFHDAAANQMVERSWTMPHEPHARAFDRATPTVQLAGTAALVAEKLRGGEAAKQIDLDQLAPVVNALRGQYASNPRAQELITMFEQMRRQSGRQR